VENLIESKVLAQYTGGDAVIECEILEAYVAASVQDFDSLCAARAAGEIEEVQRRAHRIKGATRMIGAGPLGDAAEALEHAARGGEGATLEVALSAFTARRAELLAFVTARLQPQR